MPSVKVNDINVYYELHGQGEPLVIINGLGSDMTDFMPITLRLSQNYRVLAFDNRGAGRTDRPDMPYTIKMMADDTAAVMEAADMRQAHILGISMGGRIAMALALQHPDKIRSLVLVSTFARQTPMTFSSRMLFFIKRIPLIEARSGKYPQPDYAFARQLKASRGYDCSSRLGGIHVPTLILHGTSDRIAPLPRAEEMHAGIEGSEMITFPGGHIFFMFAAERFCDTVSAFLAGVKI
jgi:3-oxoadipate enol-lactonase